MCAIWFSVNESFVKINESLHCCKMLCIIVNYFGINGLIKSIILISDCELMLYAYFLSYGRYLREKMKSKINEASCPCQGEKEVQEKGH